MKYITMEVASIIRSEGHFKTLNIQTFMGPIHTGFIWPASKSIPRVIGSLYGVISHYMAMLCNQIEKYFSSSRDNSNSPLLDDSPLCEACSTLDLDRFFREGVLRSDPPIILGALTTILSNTDTCGLCHLISLVFSRSWRLDLHPDEDLTSVQVQLRVSPCGWEDSTQHLLNERRISCAHRIRLLADPPIAIRQMQIKLNIGFELDLQMMEDDAKRFGRKRAFHGRRVEAEVNIKRIKEWMRICEKEHGPTCADVWKDVIEQLPQGVLMIDVVHMAIVEAPRDCRYFALSYVWGNSSTKYQTVSENVAQRLKRASLKTVELPRTISDAIKLVQKLEERYLWVDALCIIQDDIIHKETQIAAMHVIYGAAALTIFAAGGDSAQAPLPGLEPGSRQKIQLIRKIQSLQLTMPLKILPETLTALKWNMRGWTFQEHILSRRRLFFTNEQLYFECERDEFREDVIAESCMESGVYPGQNSTGCPKLHIYQGRPKYEDELYRRYSRKFMDLIVAYSIRQLTNDDDIYNAVFALITVLSRGFEMSPLDPNKAFLFGMPMSVLEDAMLWQPALDAPAHERRFVKGLVTPSWSWAGWKGGVMYVDSVGESIYYSGPPGSYQSQKGSLVNEWVIGDPEGRARRISLQRTAYLGVPVKYNGPRSPPCAPLVEEGDSLAPGTLLFYTTAAFLRVRKVGDTVDKIAMSQGVGVYGSKFHSIFEILSDMSPPAKMGKIVLPTNTDTSEPLEFIVLSRASVDCSDLFDQQVFGERYLGCLLNVMAVRRVGRIGNGMDVSERFGVGIIVEAAWITTRFKEQVVCLQ